MDINHVTKNPDRAPALRPGERIDDLQRDGLLVIQHPNDFCFGMDAVLLADFCRVKPGESVVELGTGSGVILLLLAAKTRASRLIGLEIQPHLAERAARSVAINGLEARVEIRCGDLKEAALHLGYGSARVVVCNPPFFAASASAQNTRESLRLARHEIACSMADCVEAAGRLLPSGGRAYFIHRSERAYALMRAMENAHIEPKRFRFVQPYADRPPNLALVEGVKCGRPGLIALPSLIVREPNGDYTPEIACIYGMDK